MSAALGAPFVQIEALSGSSGPVAREKRFNAPPVETVAARLEQLGVFRDDSVGANQSATAMTLQTVEATAPTAHVACMVGTIVGIVAQAVSTTTHGAISAGTMTFQPTLGGVAVGKTAVLSDPKESAVVMFDTPVPYAALDLLGVTLASASLSPTTSYGRAWLLIRHDGMPPVDAAGPAGGA